MDNERLVAITEQGNLGQGIHDVQNEQEREMLKQRLREMEKGVQNNSK